MANTRSLSVDADARKAVHASAKPIGGGMTFRRSGPSPSRGIGRLIAHATVCSALTVTLAMATVVEARPADHADDSTTMLRLESCGLRRRTLSVHHAVSYRFRCTLTGDAQPGALGLRISGGDESCAGGSFELVPSRRCWSSTADGARAATARMCPGRISGDFDLRFKLTEAEGCRLEDAWTVGVDGPSGSSECAAAGSRRCAEVTSSTTVPATTTTTTSSATITTTSTTATSSPATTTTTAPPLGCSMPAAGPNDLIVLFGAYGGDAVSTATVVGQDDETDTARVVIAPGSAPLYVVLSSFESTIWRFEGQVSRVSQVVLVGVREQGVVGVPAGRVTDLARNVDYLTDANCFAPFYDTQTVEGVLARGVVAQQLGRPADVFAGNYDVGTLQLPAATVMPGISLGVPAGFDPTIYQLNALTFDPGGLVEIDPMQVVSASSATAYDIFPAGMGLAQLTGAGALVNHSGDFYIAKPFARFPANLTGAEAVRFILGTGVPLPAGSPGHSCVVSEATGLPIYNANLCF